MENFFNLWKLVYFLDYKITLSTFLYWSLWLRNIYVLKFCCQKSKQKKKATW